MVVAGKRETSMASIRSHDRPKCYCLWCSSVKQAATQGETYPRGKLVHTGGPTDSLGFLLIGGVGGESVKTAVILSAVPVG